VLVFVTLDDLKWPKNIERSERLLKIT